MHDAGDDRRRAVGVQAARPRGARPRASRRAGRACARHVAERQHVAVDAFAGRTARAPGRSPPATSRCRPRRSPPSRAARTSARDRGRDRSRARPRPALAARRAPAGRCARWRSVWRTTPAWVETWKLTSSPRPTTSSVEPPPMSMTTRRRASAGGRARWSRRGRSAAPPRRRRSSARRGRSARATRAMNVAPLAASRTALVSTATRAARRRCSSIDRAGSRPASRARAPSPRRLRTPVCVDALAEPRDLRAALELGQRGRRRRRRRRAGASSSCRCRRRRRAACRRRLGVARRGASACRRRRGERGCRRRGRPSRARAVVRGRADVGDDEQVGRVEQRVVGRQRLGVGDVERGAGEPALAQRVGERVLVDDRAARGVDEDRVGLHARERVGVDRGGGSRSVSGAWSETKSARSSAACEVVAAVDHDDVHLEPARRAWRPPGRCARRRRSRASRRGRRRRASPAAPTCATGPRGRPGAASGRRRAAASSSAKARSAVASVSTSGVTPTGMPRAARRLEVDVVEADRVVRDGPQLRRGVEQLGVDAVGEQRQQPLGARAHARAAVRAAAAGRPARRRRRARPARRSSAVAGQSAGDEDAGHGAAFSPSRDRRAG